MVPTLRCLLLLWLGWRVAAGTQEEPVEVFQATESDTVALRCVLDGLGPTPASNYLKLTWLGPLGTMVLNMEVKYLHPEHEASPDMDWGLLIHNVSRQCGVQFTCRWEGNPDKEVEVSDYPSDMEYGDMNTDEEMDNSSGGNNSFVVSMRDTGALDFFSFAQDLLNFPCNGSETSNWTQRALTWRLPGVKKAELRMLIRRTPPYELRVHPGTISLMLPYVTSRDAGNYTCYWRNQSQHFLLEVSAKSALLLYSGKYHWIIWSVALGYMAVCLGFTFGFLRWRRWRRAFRGHRQKKKLRTPAMRKVLHVQRNRAPASDGILLTKVKRDGKEQVDVFSYENVLPNVSTSAGQQSLQRRDTLPTAPKEEEEDDEEYECPDSETEQKSDDQDNYENTQGETKQEEAVSNADSSYENSSWNDPAQNLVSEDGDNYENVEQEKNSPSAGAAQLIADGDSYENVEQEKNPLSPGAARLIAGLRLQLSLDHQVDKQDGGSEASTGSQSYEEMNGTLSPDTSKVLHTSNEEDADSYENMESPNSFTSGKEINLDPRGEGIGSVRKNLYIPFGADL